MARAAMALGAVLIVAGGGALGFALTRKAPSEMTPEASAAMASAVGKLDGDVREARASVAQRARTLSESRDIAAPIGSDESTASERIGKELTFKLEPNESIELVQVPKGGKPEPLFALPKGSGKLTAAAGPAAELSGEQLLVSHTFSVEAGVEQYKLTHTGFVTARRAIDLAPAFKMLRDAGVTGSFELAGKSAVLGPLPAGAKTEARSLPSEKDARLVMGLARAQGGLPLPLVAGGAGAAALGLALVLIGMLAGKKRGQSPEQAAQSYIQSMPTVESRPPPDAYAQTKLSAAHAVATGTPSPVDSLAFSINPSNLGPGALIGRWEVVRRLGSGGMADVYLAHAKGEAGFEKLVAIKVMHSHLARNQRAVEHFLDEAKLAARIHHPNVVGIQDLGKIGNDYVIVMDFVEGVDLERLLSSAREAQRPVPLDVALGILVRICDGLNAAHTAVGPDGTALGIIHRDVKSANVLVSRQGGVKVVDFGIAKAAVQGHMTMAGETKGTPSMMAPEQRVGEVVDVRADVYSLAAVGYEIVTGHAVNLDLAALAHLGVENWPHLPLPSSLRANLPQELDEILLVAMSFEREKRPADCAVFGAQFEDVMKRHNLSASDKDIARWAESELRLLVPAFQGVATAVSKPVIG
ncbi:MAG TPA: serine/threonine-protein kinase [Kofleriaceae bacterium]|nr:serine/threonine-protein kinase [Kofleriaceae bacterium]